MGDVDDLPPWLSADERNAMLAAQRAGVSWTPNSDPEHDPVIYGERKAPKFVDRFMLWKDNPNGSTARRYKTANDPMATVPPVTCPPRIARGERGSILVVINGMLGWPDEEPKDNQ